MHLKRLQKLWDGVCFLPSTLSEFQARWQDRNKHGFKRYGLVILNMYDQPAQVQFFTSEKEREEKAKALPRHRKFRKFALRGRPS